MVEDSEWCVRNLATLSQDKQHAILEFGVSLRKNATLGM
jgi:hypothetical protein